MKMKRVLVAYYSAGGATEEMAGFIAEGLRIAGCEAEVKKVAEIRTTDDLSDYDGYIFGCPTYHGNLPEAMDHLLLLAGRAGLAGKRGGAFSSTSHPGGSRAGAAGRLFETMEKDLDMKMTDLGPFNLADDLFDHPDAMGTCHDYGRAVGEVIAGEDQ